jgi:hypothetical protein
MQIIGLDRRIDKVKLGDERQMLDFRCRLDTQLILRAARGNSRSPLKEGLIYLEGFVCLMHESLQPALLPAIYFFRCIAI